MEPSQKLDAALHPLIQAPPLNFEVEAQQPGSPTAMLAHAPLCCSQPRPLGPQSWAHLVLCLVPFLQLLSFKAPLAFKTLLKFFSGTPSDLPLFSLFIPQEALA